MGLGLGWLFEFNAHYSISGICDFLGRLGGCISIGGVVGILKTIKLYPTWLSYRLIFGIILGDFTCDYSVDHDFNWLFPARVIEAFTSDSGWMKCAFL